MREQHKLAYLIKAWADGATIQIYDANKKKWIDMGHPGDDRQPGWLDEFEYRVKPESVVRYIPVFATVSGVVIVGAGVLDRGGARTQAVAGDTLTGIMRVTLDHDTKQMVSCVMEPV